MIKIIILVLLRMLEALSRLDFVVKLPPPDELVVGDNVPPGGADQGAGAQEGGQRQTREHDLQHLGGQLTPTHCITSTRINMKFLFNLKTKLQNLFTSQCSVSYPGSCFSNTDSQLSAVRLL